MNRNPRVIVIEDEAHIARLLEFVLTRNGYDVQVAGTGTDGLRLFGQSTPDAVLLDLNLPDMTGAEVLAAVRASPQTANTPVIILSAHTFDYDTAVAAEDGRTVRIPKPVAPSRLLDCLNDFGLVAPVTTEVA